jgi:hypothetical protein
MMIMMMRATGSFNDESDSKESFFIGWNIHKTFDDWYKNNKGISLKAGLEVLRVIREGGSDEAILEALGIEGRLALACQCRMLDWFWKTKGNDLRRVWPGGVLKHILVHLARTLKYMAAWSGPMNSLDVPARYTAGQDAMGRTQCGKGTSRITWHVASQDSESEKGT